MDLSDEQLERLAAKVVVKLDLTQFSDAVASKIKEAITPLAIHAARSDVPRRMNVQEFGVCIKRVPEIVRRYIRRKRIPSKYVEGRNGSAYMIDREALELFNVTLEVAAERLRAWHLAEARGTAQIPAPAHEQSAA